jgi:hypothetical protein
MAETSTTWYDFTNLFHAFAAAPVTHGTVVDVAGGADDVVVDVDVESAHALLANATTKAMGRKRFMTFFKLGDTNHRLRESSKRLSQ